MNTLVIIPALNEEKMIGTVINDLKDNGYHNILVIDDGSSDGTTEQAVKAGANVSRHLINRGLGAGLGTGFEYAKKTKPDILITFDADGQHKAKDLANLISPIVKGQADVVIGTRFKDFDKIPPNRKIANYLSNLVTFIFYGVWTTDSQSGLRAFNSKAIDRIRLITDRMEVSSEFFREIRTKKLIFKEIPIAAVYTEYSLKGSKQGNIALASIKIGLKMLISLFR